MRYGMSWRFQSRRSLKIHVEFVKRPNNEQVRRREAFRGYMKGLGHDA